MFFSLFIEDLELLLLLQERVSPGFSIVEINLILLLFADDMVLIGISPEDLQNSLDRLHTYCSECGLSVNSADTKVVFRQRGHLQSGESWKYNKEPTEVLNDFNYLDIVFYYTGLFSLNQEAFSGSFKTFVIEHQKILF